MKCVVSTQLVIGPFWFIQDDLKEKDQCIRKQQQELESLLFRNEQLSKRVSVLQEELEKSSHSKRRYLQISN